MRARWVKPEFFTDKKVSRLSPTARLLFLGMPTICDDGWVCPAEPEHLKASLFLYASEDSLEISRGLRQLAETDRIRLIRVGDDLFAFLPRMAHHHPGKFRYLGQLHDALTREAPESSSELLEGYFPSTSTSTSTNTSTSTSKQQQQQHSSSSTALVPQPAAPLTLTPQESAVVAKTTRRRTVEAGLRLGAEVVYRYWRDTMHKPAAILTPARAARIMARLRENGGDVSELLYVVDGAVRDDWTMGRDPRSPKPYNGTETIFRDREKVETLLALARDRRDPHPYLSEPPEAP